MGIHDLAKLWIIQQENLVYEPLPGELTSLYSDRPESLSANPDPRSSGKTDHRLAKKETTAGIWTVSDTECWRAYERYAQIFEVYNVVLSLVSRLSTASRSSLEVSALIS